MHTKTYLIAFTAVILIFAVCISPAAAYANYEFIWTSSGNQLVAELCTGGLSGTPHHTVSGYEIGVTHEKYTCIITPFVNSINKNGVHPKVRYLWFALKMPVGVKANSIYVSNGPNLVYSKTIDWAGTGAYKEYMLDMGSYKDMNRGINTELDITNTLGTDQTLYAYGAGAKGEW